MKHYDLAIIGTGPAGQKAAMQAAKLGKKVCIIERSKVLGGVAVNTGTIPSKALREAVMLLTSSGKQTLLSDKQSAGRRVTMSDLIYVADQVIRNEWQVIRKQFSRNNVDLIWGEAHFEGPNLLQVIRETEEDSDTEMITADKFLIGVGTKPAKPKTVPFDGKTVLCSDQLLKINRLPRTMIVVGGGVIGSEYACIMAAMGVRVTLIEGRSQVLGFLDRELAEAFQYHMRNAGITLRMGEKVNKIEKIPNTNRNNEDAPAELVQATLESGKRLTAQTLLYAIGRQGVCGKLALDNVGVPYDDRERLKVNEHYQTEQEHIYAAGDVIGFPALASTSMEQGRLAVCHMFGKETSSIPELFPLGIYAIPEISMVGKTEEQLTEAGIPYEAGIAHYKEIARGQLLGDDTGMLKLLIHQEDHRLLGVHIIGTGATELVHIGQMVMAFNGTVEFIINNVFNYPTLAEAYKVAALNGYNKLEHIR